MEHVKSEDGKNGETLYQIAVRKMDSADHTLPTSRSRTYIVGWLRSKGKQATFPWPAALPMKSIDEIIQSGFPEHIPADMTCLNNLARLLTAVTEAGYATSQNIFLDVYQSAKFGDHWQIDMCPT